MEGQAGSATSLANVAAAVKDSPEAALLALIAAWRERPLIQVAELVVLASRRVTGAPFPGNRSLVQEHEHWLAMEARRNPVDLDGLLSHLLRARASLSRERLARIATWPDDPRIGAALARITIQKPFTSRPNRPFWTTLFRALNNMAHPLMLPILKEGRPETLGTDFDAYLADKLVTLIERIERARPLVPSENEKALLRTVGDLFGVTYAKSEQKVADDFLRDIWAHPHDDGARLVFADWLHERGDPRGEFIVLQFARAAGKTSAPALRRERALLAEHGLLWIGPLAPAVRSPKFERGFLYSCRIAWRRLLSAKLSQHPAWATVREYDLESAADLPCDAWLDHMIALGSKRTGA